MPKDGFSVKYVIQYMERDTEHPALAAYSFKEIRMRRNTGRGEARMEFRKWWRTAQKKNPAIVRAKLVEITRLEER